MSSPLMTRLLTNRSGNTGLMMAFFTLLAATAIGGAADYTAMTSNAAKLQDAADSAALATTLALSRNPTLTSSQLKAKAQEMTQPALKGDNKQAVSASVSVESTLPARVAVTFSQPRHLFFGGLLKISDPTIVRKATAVAGQGIDLCMLVLSPESSNALTVSGTADLKAVKCGIQVNSNSSQAIGGNGNATVTSKKSYVVGPNQNAKNWTPKPLFDQPVYPDPFASKMPWPAAGGCAINGLVSLPKGVTNITSGIICGGITIGNGKTLKLGSGTYVVQSGGVSVRSGGVLDASSGATLVLTDPTATINVQAGGSMILQSPKSGPWAGIALAVKPQPVERTSTLIGGGEFELDGLVYMPSQKLNLTGGASIEKRESPRAFVANRVELSGNGQMFIRGSPGVMSKPADVRLVK